MIINKIRSLMNPNKTLYPYSKKREFIKPKIPYIAITFDDGYETDYTVAYPELSSRNMKGTSYICPGNIPNSALLDWTQINEMYNNGWDFQCHTYTHDRVTDLTEQELRDNMVNVNNAFTSNGLPVPQHHAYPYGIYNDQSRLIISDYRLTQRSTGYTIEAHNDHETAIPYIKAFAGDTKYNDTEKYNQVIEFINYIRNYQKIGVLYFHKIHLEQTAESGCYKDYFIDYLNKINSLKINVVTISELYDILTQK